MTTTAENTTVPLSKLFRSERNVRKTGKEANIEALAASIAREGVLQNLVVTKAPKGRFAVEAGGRRLAALQLLASRKAIAKTFPTPVKIIPNDAALTASLAENVMQAPMHAADQFEAFAALIADGASVEDVAARYGVTPAVVSRRLKLANVSPVIIEAFRADRLTLNQVMGFTVSHEHAAQERAFGEIMERAYHVEREQIIRMLTTEKVATDDRRFHYIGEAAYAEAGGTVTRDLFDMDGGGFAEDSALLDRLVHDRLSALIPDLLAAGWKWIDVVVPISFEMRREHSRIYEQTCPLSPEKAARLDELSAQYQALEAQTEDATAHERLAAIEAEMTPLESEQYRFDPAEMALAGGWISLDYDGSVITDLGYVRKADLPALQCLQQGAGTAASAASATHTAPEAAPTPSTGGSTSAGRLSDAVMTDLYAARTAALQLALADQPAIGLRAVAYTLAAQVIISDSSALSIRTTQTVIPDISRPACPDLDPLKARVGRWQLRLPGERAALWPAIVALTDEDVQDLIAVCAALSVDALYMKPDPYGPRADHQHRIAHADQLAATLALDMARHWTPRPDYFARLTKDGITAAVREAKGDEAADQLTGLKKTAMAAEAARLLAGSGWLPAPLRGAS